LGLVTAATLAASAASAQDGEESFDRTPRKCISTSRIRNTDIIDDQTIVFHLRGNREIYRSYLARTCPGLERNDRFSYRTTSGQLCDVDTITVLEQFGTRFNPSFTCRLGEFVPITPEEAEQLALDNEDAIVSRKAITSEAVELPAEDEAADNGASDEQPEAGAAAGEAQAAPAPKEQSRRERRRSENAGR
jgi:hypothetical protein